MASGRREVLGAHELELSKQLVVADWWITNFQFKLKYFKYTLAFFLFL